MKYTIKTFIRSLLNKKDYSSLLEREGAKDLVLLWDGDSLSFTAIYDKASEYQIDSIIFDKERKNIFRLDLQSNNYWYLVIEFSDGGLKKNKKYKLSEIYS
jgi:hypothetical protein